MNWSEFSDARERILPRRCSALMMDGVMFDNGTRCNTKQNYLEHDNDYFSLFLNFAGSWRLNSKTSRGPKWPMGRDFVWTGTKVRTGSGHPFLAGFDSVFCAGRVEEDYFFFHSGHYHPKRVHALIYFSDFVLNSCSLLRDSMRDSVVDGLCKMRLRLYHEYSVSDIYDTSFEMEAMPRAQATAASPPLKSVPSGRAPTPAMQIKGRGDPVPTIKESPQWRSENLQSSSESPPLQSWSTPPLEREVKERKQPIIIPDAQAAASGGAISLFAGGAPSPAETLGITGTGLALSQLRSDRRARWIPDSERSKCARCGKVFTAINRKHHCRQCGDIFCGDCSKYEKYVKFPATESATASAKGNKGLVRVCLTCLTLRELTT
jgi:FYVE-type zinc finger protein